MIYGNGKTDDIRIAYTGGRSRGWAWKFMANLAVEPSMNGTIILYDIDQEAARADEIIGNKVNTRFNSMGKWNHIVADSLKAAPTGCDFVVISTLPGTFDEMEPDVHLPKRLGTYQSMGDTAGSEGVIRALRALPMFMETGEATKECIPNAWVVNYTNPMSLCIQILYDALPGIKAFGRYYKMFGTQRILTDICSLKLGIRDIQGREIIVGIQGINYFTRSSEAFYQGINLFPVYEELTNGYHKEGFDSPGRSWANSIFCCTHRVKFDLFRWYGMIAVVGDHHLAEFTLRDRYLNDPETVESWEFGLTTVQRHKRNLGEKLEKSKKLILGEMDVDMEPSGREGIFLARVLTRLDRLVSNVNLPNTGQCPDLLLGSMVGTNAVFYRDHVRPVLTGTLPEGIRSLVLPHLENHKRILQVPKTYDKTLVMEAFMGDPLVRVKCRGEEAIARLVDDMVWDTQEYPPEGWNRQKKKTIMRKRLALTVLVGLLATSLAGCMPNAAPSSAAGVIAQTEKQGQPSETGGKEGTSEESEGGATIRINWWGGDSRHEATLKGIHALGELHPSIHVEPEYETYSEHQEKIVLALNSRVAADVLQMNMNWIFDYSPKGDTFLDLSTVSDVLDLTAYEQSDLDFYIINGFLRAVPVSKIRCVFFWNETTFDKIGVPIPSILDELVEAGKEFSEYGNGSHYPLVTLENEKIYMTTHLLECKYGKPWVDDIELQCSREELIDRFELMKMLEDSHMLPSLERMARDGADLIGINQDWINGHYAGIYM